MRYALIGATGIGGYHLETLRRMASAGDVKVIAAADPVFAKMPELGTEMGAKGTRPYTDYREMLRGEAEIDVVVISAPIPFHLEMTLACLERDVSIYLEKPPVPLIQQLRTMIAADHRRRIGVGFQMINASWIREAKRAIVNGEVGQLQSIRIGACWPRLDHYYSRNGSAGRMTAQGEPVFDGPATNAMAHLVHNAMFLAGATPHGYDAPSEVQAELYRARPIESYDVACLRAKLNSGVTVTAALTHATEEMVPYCMELRGSKGWIRITEDGEGLETSFPWTTGPRESFEDMLAATHQQFFEFAKGTCEQPATSLINTLGYVLTTNGMMLSSREIHDIDQRHVRRYESGEESGYDVPGLSKAVRESVRTGKLFSELKLPWAASTETVLVDDLRSLTLPTSVSQAVPQPA